MLEGCVPWPKEFVDKYKEKGYWRNLTLGQAFDQIAEVFPHREAMVFNELRTTFFQLKKNVDNLAVNILKSGIKPRDRIIVQLPNIPEFVYFYYAFLKIGVIPVMCLPQHRFAEIKYIAELCDAKGYLIVDSFRKFNFLQLAKELQADVPGMQKVFVVGKNCLKGQILFNKMIQNEIKVGSILEILKQNKPDPEDVAIFLLSGGTTGLPKIIPRTHNDYLYNANITGLHMGTNKENVYLAIAPLAHNKSLACPGLMGTMFEGGKIVLTTSTAVETICSVIEREKVTHLGLVPALIISLLNFEKRHLFNLSSLKIIKAGGSKLNPQIAKRIEPELGCKLVQQLGMAEGLLTMTDISDPERVVFETVGRKVCPEDEIKIVDDAGKEVAPGKIGELLCRGPYTIRGYYKAPEHNEKAFTAEGFYKTGDMVSMDIESGCLIIEGRKKDLINRGGEKISAEEIENLILANPKVKNVAVVAMPDPLLGEKCCAYVILRENQKLNFDELINFLLDKKIAKFKLPERLEIVKEFPATNLGKVSKKELRRDIEQKIAKESQDTM